MDLFTEYAFYIYSIGNGDTDMERQYSTFLRTQTWETDLNLDPVLVTYVLNHVKKVS